MSILSPVLEAAGWSPLILLNVMASALGCLLSTLAFIGYAPLIRLQGTKAQRRVVLMILGFFVVAVVRMWWWDFARPLGSAVGLLAPLPPPTWRTAVNLVANLGVVWSLLMGLSALYLTIDPAERRGYSWLNAPWYPPGSRPILRLLLGPHR